MAENPENFQERLYNISNLNIWFAISSLIFLAVLLWSFVDDYSNDWKDYQREFRNLQVEKTNEELKIASSVFEGSKKYNELQSKLKTFNEKLKQKSSEIANVDKILLSKRAILYRVQQSYNFLKANYDALKYEYEEAVSHHLPTENILQEKLDVAWTDLLEKQLINESAQDDFDEQTALLKKFSEELDKVIAEERELTKEATLIERKLIKLDPAHMDFSNKIGNTVRDLPFIDFLSPYYKVDQVVVNDLTDNVNFTRVPKVDRCMTCHKGILKKEFENQ